MDRFQEEDRLSALTDDVLLHILARVDLSTAARTSTLSTRWRQLPWLLTELSINVKDFLPVPHPHPIEENDMVGAMASLTQAARSLLARPRRGSAITKLHLKIYLINYLTREIGPPLCSAINAGLLRDLDLAVLDETEVYGCEDSDMQSHAKRMFGFFIANPSVLNCLTRLSLRNMCFDDGFNTHMHYILFDCCKQLKHLALSNCDVGVRSLWKIDAPNSKLRVLELTMCYFERIEFVCLPKLEKLDCDTWARRYAPFSFGIVPFLVELHLSNSFRVTQHALKLSELLHGAAGIHTLTLNFQGENIWVQPEIKQLARALKNLRKLSLLGIFAEFDLLWTTAFLEAAPSIEVFHIRVYEEHVCEVHDEVILQAVGKRTNPRWEMDFGGSKNLLLKELQLFGFTPLEQQLAFIKLMIERAPNLQTIVLNKDDTRCEDCVTRILNAPPGASTRPGFPKNKDEQDAVVRRVTGGTSFSGRIKFL